MRNTYFLVLHESKEIVIQSQRGYDNGKPQIRGRLLMRTIPISLSQRRSEVQEQLLGVLINR